MADDPPCHRDPRSAKNEPAPVGFVQRLSVLARAAAHVPLPALVAHLRRRLRNHLVPRFAVQYERHVTRLASTLPDPSAVHGPRAQAAAETVSAFFAAKHGCNIPQCFEGRFTFLNRTHDFGSIDAIDWAIDMDDAGYQLWRANLCFMGYLCTAADTRPQEGLRLAAQIIASFTRSARFDSARAFGESWNSYPVSQRILALSALLIRLPASCRAMPEYAEVARFLRFNVAFLLGNLETELGYNHLERNLSALALYALACGQTPRTIERPLKRHFRHIVLETIGQDGVQLERSAMYQGFTIQSLRVLAQLDCWSASETEAISQRLASAETALAVLTLGDGQHSLMNDAWIGEIPSPSAILDGSDPPGFARLAHGGYVRLAMKDAVVLLDGAPIGPDANPGHGHADYLGIEMSLANQRLFVDPGTPSYSPGAERDRSRSWQSHNGPCFENGNRPVEFLGSFKVGRRAMAQIDYAGATPDSQSASASLAFAETRVSRKLVLVPGRLTIEDSWLAGPGRPLTRFLIPSQWLAHEDGDAIVLQASGVTARIRVDGASLTRHLGQWSCRYNQRENAHVIKLRPIGKAARLIVDWCARR
ncbi:heparinase II/III-family protein [Novosphingobium sp. YJ-S2-02]|uniref:Heparinase II/III-family protein n=1 Tax=Novosphingobium aureum TaxID=2792964 RepID=A0A931HEM6_9SPHN|nr:heparinase II/III-family protein [Novosphingobium aureum]MBH0113969.1 heparinase II/III-family protein [Novosphingobium aureum]